MFTAAPVVAWPGAVSVVVVSTTGVLTVTVLGAEVEPLKPGAPLYTAVT
jgi:hypothetical protein